MTSLWLSPLRYQAHLLLSVETLGADNVSWLFFYDRVLGSHIPLLSLSRRASQTRRVPHWGCTLHHHDPSASQSKILLLCVSIPSFLVIWKLSPGYEISSAMRTPPSRFVRELEKLL